MDLKMATMTEEKMKKSGRQTSLKILKHGITFGMEHTLNLITHQIKARVRKYYNGDSRMRIICERLSGSERAEAIFIRIESVISVS